jgi:hypothetical protein
LRGPPACSRRPFGEATRPLHGFVTSFGAPLAIVSGTGIPEGASASVDEEEVIQQMQSHYIAALVRSDVDLTEVRTS